MIDDAQLLRQYVEDRSEDAFTELVHRHVNLVYFAALRRVGGDAPLADEVAQNVFADLARKASSLQNRPLLAGWLYTSTRFAAAQAVRSERRRRTHEQEAHTMHELHAAPEPDWEQLRPVIDAAMDDLNEREREAVLMRYFENRPLAEIGTKFSLSPDAARMRVDRALEKLRRLLARRGIASTAGALATAFATGSAMAAPAGLVAKIVSGTLSHVGTATTATLALWKIVTGVAIAGLGAGMVVYEAHGNLPPAAGYLANPQAVGATTPAAAAVEAAPVQRDERAAAQSAAPGTGAGRIHRTTEDFGWPQVGLFAGDGGGRPGHTIAEFRAKMEADAEFREAVIEQATTHLDLFYGYLFKSLQLSPAQLDQLKILLVDKEQLRIDTVESQQAMGLPAGENRDLFREGFSGTQQQVDAEINALLGDSGYVHYLQYREDLVPWTVANAVAAKVEATPTPLTGEQANRLVLLLRRPLLRIKSPYTFDLCFGAGLFSAHIGSGLNQRTLDQAATFLSSAQLEALRQLQRPRNGSQR